MEEEKKVQFERIQDQSDNRSFGEYLRRERELRDITLREIADETKVSFRYLHALETDNTEKLPAEVFIKGFIKSYAQYIGLDPDEAMLRYQELKRQSTDPPKEQPRFVLQESPAASWLQNRSLWLALLAVLVLAGGLVYLQARHRGAPAVAPEDRFQTGFEKERPAETAQEEIKKAEPSSESAEGEAAGNPSMTPDTGPPVPETVPENVKAVPAQGPATLVLTALERTWVAVDLDETAHKEYILEVGDEVPLKMKESLRLTIGNAGGLVIRSGGKTLGPFGRSGRVKKNYVLTREALDRELGSHEPAQQ